MEIKGDDYLNKLIIQKHNRLIKFITGILFSTITAHNSQSNQPVCLICHK